MPCKKKQEFTTVYDYQDEIDVRIFEGERSNTDGNHLLGEFQITGIERAKKGEPKIDVQFEVNTNGLLTVTARDRETGANAEVKLQHDRGRLSPEEIERMCAEAEAMRAEDERAERSTRRRLSAARFKRHAPEKSDDVFLQPAMIDTTSTVVACEIETIHLQSNDAMKRTARTRVVRRVSAEGAFSRNLKKMKRKKWSERSCTGGTPTRYVHSSSFPIQYLCMAYITATLMSMRTATPPDAMNNAMPGFLPW